MTTSTPAPLDHAALADLDEAARLRVEAAAFRRLVAHLQERTDAQNIDLMNLAGFCRNCLSKWYAAAAETEGVSLDKAAAREIVYGMPYDDWKAQHQLPATPAQASAFAATAPESPSGGPSAA